MMAISAVCAAFAIASFKFAHDEDSDLSFVAGVIYAMISLAGLAVCICS